MLLTAHWERHTNSLSLTFKKENTRNVSAYTVVFFIPASTNYSRPTLRTAPLMVCCCQCTNNNVWIVLLQRKKKVLITVSQCIKLNLVENKFAYFRFFPSLRAYLSPSLSLSHSHGVRTKYFLSPIRVLAPCRAH